MSDPDEPNEFSRIAKVIPRRRVALLIFVVLLNMGAVAYYRGREIAGDRRRYVEWHGVKWAFETPVDQEDVSTPPWRWTVSEWAETWPWSRKTRARKMSGYTLSGLALASSIASGMAKEYFSRANDAASETCRKTIYCVGEYLDLSGHGKRGVWLIPASDANAISAAGTDLVRDEWGQPIRLHVPGKTC